MDYLRRLFNRSNLWSLSGERPAQAAPITLRAEVVIFNPRTSDGRRLSEYMGWHDPDTLTQQYIADMRTASGGIAQYEVVARREIDQFPIKEDGFRYHVPTFLRNLEQRGGFHQPDTADYAAMLEELGSIERVERNEIDEVWWFGFPYAGFYESRMVGPGAFWCNAPPLPRPTRRRFVVMGFNYERDVGCMLENFGHRVESIMEHVYRQHRGDRHLWHHFIRYDQVAPGRASCGNVHFAPSSLADYDWGNPRPVLSNADAWYNFPDLSAPARQMQCSEWGHGDMRAHHLWWFDHLPRLEGQTDGVLNNWWRYALIPDEVR